MVENKPLILEEFFSIYEKCPPRVDFSLKLEGEHPFAIAYSSYLDEHFLLVEVNPFTVPGNAIATQYRSGGPEDRGWKNTVGVAHNFLEAQRRLYSRIRRQGKIIANKEGREYIVLRKKLPDNFDKVY